MSSSLFYFPYGQLVISPQVFSSFKLIGYVKLIFIHFQILELRCLEFFKFS
jgi:hypothetical protein